MYERFYQLRERPFALTPDPEYLYLSRVHRETLDYLRLGIEASAGFVAVTGEVGSGKTMLLQALLRTLDNRATVARLVNTLLEPKELLEAILIDFGVDPVPQSKPAMVRDLARILVEQHVRGQRVLVVIDEAQNLSRGALEELRMLSNLETEKSKLMQIVLVGQPDLRQRLASPHLEQLRQRITVRYHLEALDARETCNYINHRLRRAALGPPLSFPREVTDAIHGRSRGIPRMINVICDAVLFVGYSEDCRRIDQSILPAVFEELESTGVLSPATTPIRRPWGRAPIVNQPWAHETPEPGTPRADSEAPVEELTTSGAGRPIDRDRPRMDFDLAVAPAATEAPAPPMPAADMPLESAPLSPDAAGPVRERADVDRSEPPRPRAIWDRTKQLLFDPPATAQKNR